MTPRAPAASPKWSTPFPDQIKAALIPLLVEAHETTARQAARKERLLRLAVAVTLVGVVVALVAKTIRG